MRVLAWILLLVPVGAAVAKEPVVLAPVRLSEKEFRARAEKIKVGTSQQRVREQLGEPHEPADGGRWSYRNPPHRPDGPYHWYLFTFRAGKVSKIEQGGVGCVIRDLTL